MWIPPKHSIPRPGVLLPSLTRCASARRPAAVAHLRPPGRRLRLRLRDSATQLRGREPRCLRQGVARARASGPGRQEALPHGVAPHLRRRRRRCQPRRRRSTSISSTFSSRYINIVQERSQIPVLELRVEEARHLLQPGASDWRSCWASARGLDDFIDRFLGSYYLI
jgi:hypothetical protein